MKKTKQKTSPPARKPAAKKPTPATARRGGKIIAEARAIAAAKSTPAKSTPAKRRGRSEAAAALRAGRAAAKAGNTALARAIQPTLPVREIKIGTRHREDFGDLLGLVHSINERGGLLQPVVITPGHVLIAGERRLRAWPQTKFGKDPIPVTIVDVDSIVAGEWDENAQRKDFTPSEAVAIKQALEPLERAKAAEREAGGKAVPNNAKGRAADKVARVVGMDRKTIAKAEDIVEAAEAEPEKYGKLKEDMDRTGRVHGPHKRLTNLRQAEQLLKEPPPLPGLGPYRTGVMDLPWASEPNGESPVLTGRGYYKYPTMNTPEMIEFGDKVIPLLHPDGGHFWFWTTNFHLLEGHAFAVLDAWSVKAEAAGVGPIKRIGKRTWVKNVMGNGQVFRGQTEDVILCKFGKSPPALGVVLSTRLDGDVGEPSEKPAQFYRDVEAATPASRYFELFARRTIPDNWDGHGDQVGTLEPLLCPGGVAITSAPCPKCGAPDDDLCPAAKKRTRKKKAAAETPITGTVEPTLPGIAPVEAAIESPSPALRAIDVRREVDAKVIVGEHVVVTINNFPTIWEAFDKVSLHTGAGSGYPGYPVPRSAASIACELESDLAAIEASLAELWTDDLRALAIGTPDQAQPIVARSESLWRAHGLLGAFARGWGKSDGEPPAAGDDLEIPAFLRRIETLKKTAA